MWREFIALPSSFALCQSGLRAQEDLARAGTGFARAEVGKKTIRFTPAWQADSGKSTRKALSSDPH
jgi:hypothetical protein